MVHRLLSRRTAAALVIWTAFSQAVWFLAFAWPELRHGGIEELREEIAKHRDALLWHGVRCAAVACAAALIQQWLVMRVSRHLLTLLLEPGCPVIQQWLLTRVSWRSPALSAAWGLLTGVAAMLVLALAGMLASLVPGWGIAGSCCAIEVGPGGMLMLMAIWFGLPTALLAGSIVGYLQSRSA